MCEIVSKRQLRIGQYQIDVAIVAATLQPSLKGIASNWDIGASGGLCVRPAL
jgi:hypothetical protein